MSPSRPKHLRVLVGRSGLSILGDTRQTIHLGQSDAPLDEALTRGFGDLLAEVRPSSVEVLLSAGLVDTVVMPGLQHWLADSDLCALARAKLAAFYGTNQGARVVVVGRAAFGVPELAMSASQRLVDNLRAECNRCGVSLAGLRPLAAVMLNQLAKDLRATQATAVCFEEADVLWIGVRADGQWRSARSLPTSMLRQSPRGDLLQRECLSAGLVDVKRTYVAVMHDDPSCNWGASVTDCRDRLPQSRACNVGPFDFGTKSRPRLGWAVLAAAIVGVAATAYAWVDGQSRSMAAAEALAHQRQEQRQTEGVRFAADATTQTAYARAQTAYRLQRQPWRELLTAVNSAGSKAIGVTAFQADATDGTLTLEGVAKSFEDVQTFADALGARPPVSGLQIVSVVPDAETANRVKFAFDVTWPAALPGEAFK